MPLIASGGFYDTVEGTVLASLSMEIANAAKDVFYKYADEQRHRMMFSPKEGELLERAHFWRELLIKSALTDRQYRIAMARLIRRYIQIKQRNFASDVIKTL